MPKRSKKRRNPASEQLQNPPPATAERAALELPARCPRCQSTERDRKQRVLKHDFKIMIRGESYDQMVTSRVDCRGCGQRYLINTYRNLTPAPAAE